MKLATGLAAVLGLAVLAPSVRAQGVVVSSRPVGTPFVVSSTTPYPVTTSTTPTTVTYAANATAPALTSEAAPYPIYPYSYYVAPRFYARAYQGYGTNEFAFHGVPYGHPYDPWTWPYMSGAYGRGLVRYYDPPVK